MIENKGRSLVDGAPGGPAPGAKVAVAAA
jgi:hypothetical protein